MFIINADLIFHLYCYLNSYNVDLFLPANI